MPTSWALGVAIITVGAITAAVGDNLVRLSFLRDRDRFADSSTPVQKRPLWVAGICLSSILDSLFTMVALHYLPAAIVSAFGGLHLAAGALFSKCIIRETLLFRHWGGIASAVSGVIVLLAFSLPPPKAMSFVVVFEHIKKPGFDLFLILASVTLLICVYISLTPSTSRTVEVIGGRAAPAPPADEMTTTFAPVVTPVGSGSPDTTAQRHSTLRNAIQSRLWRITDVSLPTCVGLYASAAGVAICGGAALVLSSAIMRGIDFHGGASVTEWRFYVLFFPVAILSLSQVFLLNHGLESFEAINLLPATNGFLILVAVFMDASLFPEIYDMPVIKNVLMLAAVTAVLVGIFLLASADAKREVEQLQALEIQLGQKGRQPAADVLSDASDASFDRRVARDADEYVRNLEANADAPRAIGASTGGSSVSSPSSKRRKLGRLFTPKRKAPHQYRPLTPDDEEAGPGESGAEGDGRGVQVTVHPRATKDRIRVDRRGVVTVVIGGQADDAAGDEDGDPGGPPVVEQQTDTPPPQLL